MARLEARQTVSTAAQAVSTASGSRMAATGSERLVHALLLHQAYAGANEPGGTRHYEFASRMVAQGHRFTVIASNISYLTAQPIAAEPRGGDTPRDGHAAGPSVRKVFSGAGYHRS